jgi:3-deoxy-manno-octulosonate cytidylyltransferase (CMP-KDO synthetase)
MTPDVRLGLLTGHHLPMVESRRSDVIAIIPARYASTRLPGKPLLNETGRPLIQHVVEAARRATCLDRVIVATDDHRIANAVRAFGGEVILTRSDHRSGTDRIAEVAQQLETAKTIVNIQGDEPDISATAIDRVVTLLDEDAESPMATLCTPIYNDSVFRNPSRVKVGFSQKGRALYFSRSPIPCCRGESAYPSNSNVLGYLHLGIYAYCRDFLLKLASLPPSPLESVEHLEQLRVLEAGYSIAIDVVQGSGVGIDTWDDYTEFVRRWKAGGVPK